MAGHVMVEVAPEAVRVTEVYVLAVDAPVAARPEEPWIPVPDGAQALEVERGEELLRPVDGGFALAHDIEPGELPLAFTYIVPAEEGRCVIAHRLPFSVVALHVMWPDGAPVTIQAMGFTDRGTVQMGPRPMHLLEREAFAVGERLVLVTSISADASMAEAEEVPARDPLGVLRVITLVVSVLLLLAGFILPATGRWPWSSS